jgi:hypothetical protein
MEPGTLINIKATSQADRRTKTRLGTHGKCGAWVFEKENTACMLFGPTPVHAVMVVSADSKWFGWFPVNHIIMEATVKKSC